MGTLYVEWLREKAAVPYFAAYSGDLLSIAHGLERVMRDLAAAHAEMEACRQDARRYRWIKETRYQYDPEDDPNSAWAQAWNEIEGINFDRQLDLDAAIDRAMEGPGTMIERDQYKKDDDRFAWMESHLFERKWDGTIGRASYWRMAGPHRHILQKMRGETLREAIDAAMGEQT